MGLVYWKKEITIFEKDFHRKESGSRPLTFQKSILGSYPKSSRIRIHNYACHSYETVYTKNVGSESAKYSDKDEISPFYLYPVVEMWRFQVSKNRSSPLLPLKTSVLRMRREKATMVVDLVLPLQGKACLGSVINIVLCRGACGPAYLASPLFLSALSLQPLWIKKDKVALISEKEFIT